MKKRFSVILICCLLFALCACGKTQTKTAPSAEPKTETESAAETTEVPTTLAAQTQTEAPAEPETFIAATINVDFAKDNLSRLRQLNRRRHRLFFQPMQRFAISMCSH